MYRIMLLSFMFGLNLAAGEEKAACPEAAYMTDNSVIEKASHLPGFRCQRTLAVIESMVDAAIAREKLEWALAAYAHLHATRAEPSLLTSCLGTAAYTGVCVAAIVGGSYVAAFPGVLACLCCSSTAANFDYRQQSRSIKEKLLTYLQKTIILDKLTPILKELRDAQAFYNMENIFTKHSELSLDLNDIGRYYSSCNKIFGKHKNTFCCL